MELNKKITLTVKEVAELIGVSTTSVYTMVREKEIPHTRVRSKIIFHRETIEAWLRGEVTAVKQA
ncbi:helix-turn-helix domain-containing protein [Bacillus infantis]|uniref:helix-turn-helix domain-containing protein n=1 Tax=Bacillus infantis TaxID=324767 RepID=UPI003CF33405